MGPCFCLGIRRLDGEAAGVEAGLAEEAADPGDAGTAEDPLSSGCAHELTAVHRTAVSSHATYGTAAQRGVRTAIRKP
jgi:hypothetical protein